MSINTRPTDPTAEAEFELANRLFFRLYQASNLLHKNGTRHLEPFEITTQQMAVIGALTRPQADAEGMTVKDLILFLELSRQNLTAVLDRLEKHGWIERAVNRQDARSRRLRLTPEGRKMWRQMHSNVESFYAAALTDFTPQERATLVELLGRLKEGLAKT